MSANYKLNGFCPSKLSVTELIEDVLGFDINPDRPHLVKLRDQMYREHVCGDPIRYGKPY